MKKYLFYLSMALVAVVLFSCKSGKKSVFTPTSSGRAYEVLVVVEKPVWERPAGRALYNVLDTDVPDFRNRNVRLGSCLLLPKILMPS